MAQIHVVTMTGIILSLLMAMWYLGIAYGVYKTRIRLLNVIDKTPNDVAGSRNAMIVRAVKVYILDKFKEGEQKWNK